MNKQMKVALIVTVLVASTFTMVYADKPTTPNLSELVQEIMDYLADYIYPGITGLQTDLTNLQTDVDALANIPIMETVIEEKSGERTSAEPEDRWEPLYASAWYPDGAIFHVTLSGSVTGTGSEVEIHAYFPYGGGSLSTAIDDRIAQDPALDVEPVIAEFAAAQCQITADLPTVGATYNVVYCVTVTHIP